MDNETTKPSQEGTQDFVDPTAKTAEPLVVEAEKAYQELEAEIDRIAKLMREISNRMDEEIVAGDWDFYQRYKDNFYKIREGYEELLGQLDEHQDHWKIAP